MDGWEPYLHWAFRQEHVLVRPLVLDSFPSFVVAGLFLTLLCTSERMLTFSLERHWIPQIFASTRWRKALWRTLLYSVVTFLRLCYMLAAMTFQLGVILVIVLSLSSSQFVIEYWGSVNERSVPGGDHESGVSLVQPQRHSYPLNSAVSNPRSRTRSKSKPHNIFTHPMDSNFARADAVTLQLGDIGVADCARGGAADPSWGTGQERLKPRELLGRTHRDGTEERDGEGFFLMDGLDSESESSRS